MKKKKIRNSFVPFTHEELELKNALVEKARDLKNKKKLESQLASAMIYASIAEYLAEHLLENLRFFVYRSTYIDYAGIMYMDERNKGNGKGKTLGNTTALLEKYSFPDREEIISVLKDITSCRNNLFHNLAKTSANDFSKLYETIEKIQSDTEIFIEKINVVYAGLQKILIPQSEEVNKK